MTCRTCEGPLRIGSHFAGPVAVRRVPKYMTPRYEAAGPMSTSLTYYLRYLLFLSTVEHRGTAARHGVSLVRLRAAAPADTCHLMVAQAHLPMCVCGCVVCVHAVDGCL